MANIIIRFALAGTEHYCISFALWLYILFDLLLHLFAYFIYFAYYIYYIYSLLWLYYVCITAYVIFV